MLVRTVALILTCWASGLALAGGAFEILLSNESARIGHEAAHAPTNLLFDLGVDYNEQLGWATYAGVSAVDSLAAGGPVVASLGGRLYYFSTKEGVEEGGTALALGGFVRYQPNILAGLAAELNAFVAPSILAFSKADAFTDLQAKLGYQVLPQARLLAGYGYLAALYDDQWQEVTKGPFLGFRINY